ncbi:MAG TPA: N-acetyltransferase [Sporichthyaceae bacterium]|nr:N-acetyltransferase [Sporichthyaceae bacterium]
MTAEHLTHGWESDAAESDTLLRRFVLANARHTTFLAERVGGRTAHGPAYSAADPGSAVFFDNMVVLLAPPQYVDFDRVMEELLAFYPPERHFCLLSAWPTPDLAEHGLELMGHPPFMLRPPGGTAPPTPAGLTIRQVDSAAMLKEFCAVLLAAFDMPSGEGVPISDPRVLDDSLRLFLGYLDGRPVATAGARISHGLNDVEWVANLADERGKGIGAALTWAATLAEPELPATLISSDDGRGVYERMGYLPMHRFTLWHRPPF